MSYRGNKSVSTNERTRRTDNPKTQLLRRHLGWGGHNEMCTV